MKYEYYDNMLTLLFLFLIIGIAYEFSNLLGIYVLCGLALILIAGTKKQIDRLPKEE